MRPAAEDEAALTAAGIEQVVTVNPNPNPNPDPNPNPNPIPNPKPIPKPNPTQVVTVGTAPRPLVSSVPVYSLR